MIKNIKNIPPNIKSVLIIGSGPILIGQAAEFDYSGVQTSLSLREVGIKTIVVNSNPATIQTDPSMADKVYLEPLNVASLENIIVKERPDGIIMTAGGQTALMLGLELYDQGILEKYEVKILGTTPENIRGGENRGLFRDIMLEINEPVLKSFYAEDVSGAIAFAEKIDYPVILRCAFTLGGTGSTTA
ncbi:MAG: carbamoyl-phosphate synthase large subunit, partial [Endozoicomonas sp.]